MNIINFYLELTAQSIQSKAIKIEVENFLVLDHVFSLSRNRVCCFLNPAFLPSRSHLISPYLGFCHKQNGDIKSQAYP